VHSGFGAPREALELLWQQLGPKREAARFVLRAKEIRATWGEEAPVSMESDERQELGRLAVLEIVREACSGVPELSYDWYAVSLG
jgi:hypothetical protein